MRKINSNECNGETYKSRNRKVLEKDMLFATLETSVRVFIFQP